MVYEELVLTVKEIDKNVLPLKQTSIVWCSLRFVKFWWLCKWASTSAIVTKKGVFSQYQFTGNSFQAKAINLTKKAHPYHHLLLPQTSPLHTQTNNICGTRGWKKNTHTHKQIYHAGHRLSSCTLLLLLHIANSYV